MITFLEERKTWFSLRRAQKKNPRLMVTFVLRRLRLSCLRASLVKTGYNKECEKGNWTGRNRFDSHLACIQYLFISISFLNPFHTHVLFLMRNFRVEFPMYILTVRINVLAPAVYLEAIPVICASIVPWAIRDYTPTLRPIKTRLEK